MVSLRLQSHRPDWSKVPALNLKGEMEAARMGQLRAWTGHWHQPALEPQAHGSFSKTLMAHPQGNVSLHFSAQADLLPEADSPEQAVVLKP